MSLDAAYMTCFGPDTKGLCSLVEVSPFRPHRLVQAASAQQAWQEAQASGLGQGAVSARFASLCAPMRQPTLPSPMQARALFYVLWGLLPCLTFGPKGAPKLAFDLLVGLSRLYAQRKDLPVQRSVPFQVTFSEGTQTLTRCIAIERSVSGVGVQIAPDVDTMRAAFAYAAAGDTAPLTLAQPLSIASVAGVNDWQSDALKDVFGRALQPSMTTLQRGDAMPLDVADARLLVAFLQWITDATPDLSNPSDIDLQPPRVLDALPLRL